MNKKSPQKSTDSGSKISQGNWWLVLSVIALAVFPLMFIEGKYSGEPMDKPMMLSWKLSPIISLG